MKLSELAQNLKQFIRTPSKFPITLTLLTSPFAALFAYLSGSSNVGCATLTVSSAEFLGLKLRNMIYDQPYELKQSSKEWLAEEDGEFSAESYAEYFTSFLNPDAYRHPIIFGRAMFAKMKTNEAKIEQQREENKKHKLL
ncbi:MAG: hypothetical protein JSR17_02330 [Proteobacteria bacterium]|nr:hypothetical protein [Pseudomonadota bacterium]